MKQNLSVHDIRLCNEVEVEEQEKKWNETCLSMTLDNLLKSKLEEQVKKWNETCLSILVLVIR